MNLSSSASAVLALALFAGTACAQSSESELDSLVKIKSRKVDSAFLLPGADFSQYKKVMIAPAEVAFHKNWLRDQNNQALSMSRRIGDTEAKKILDAARSGFDEIWAAAFKSAGYEVVTAPGDDVLKLVPSVFDLYINAPDVQSAGRTRSYTVEAGRAGLTLDVRDSTTGTLLGRIVDRRTAGDNAGRLQWSTSVSNRADFRQLFGRWAKLAADGLTDLKQASPLPETMQPDQKMPKK